MKKRKAKPRKAKTATPPTTAKADQSCGNCYAFSIDPSDGTRGWCRFFPPVILMTAPVGGDPHMTRKAEIPVVNASDWCAQWRHT